MQKQGQSNMQIYNFMDFTPEGRPDRLTPPQKFRSEFLEKHFLNNQGLVTGAVQGVICITVHDYACSVSLITAIAAPVGSAMTPNRPTLGTSCPGTIVLAPISAALASVSSQSPTLA